MTASLARDAVREPAKSTAVTLSREELFIVLRLLKADALPGYDASWLGAGADGRVPERLRPALEAATSALAARSFLSVDEHACAAAGAAAAGRVAVAMPAPVVALVGACAFGEYGIMVAARGSGGTQHCYLHELRMVGVYHDAPLAGVHRFVALDGRGGVLAALDSALGLAAQPAAGLPVGVVPMGEVKRAIEAGAAGQHEAAARALAAAGLPGQTAQGLAVTLASATSVGTIAVFRPTTSGGVPHVAGAAPAAAPSLAQGFVIVAPRAVFLIAADDANAQTATVAAGGADSVRRWVGAHLPAATR